MAATKDTKSRKPAKTAKVALPVKKAAPRGIAATGVGRRSSPAKKTPVERRAGAFSRKERYRLIEEEAYLIAERDGFKRHPDSYWFAAEAEVNVILGASEESGDGAKI